MCVSASASRWPAATVKKRDFDSILPRYRRDSFFGFINTPICRKITTVFRSVREAEHNNLFIVSLLQMLHVSGITVHFSHYRIGYSQIVDGFKERNNIEIHLVTHPHKT